MLTDEQIMDLKGCGVNDGSLSFLLRFARAVEESAIAAEREKWRAIAQRVAADANRYGREGLKMRCTISDNGGLVSWEVNRD